mgnify:CR=1 FL=1
MAKDASFDIVSDFDKQELINAIDQVKRELITRFDLKDSNSNIEIIEDKAILITTNDEMKLKNIYDILQSKLVKRSLSLKILDPQKIENALGGNVNNIGLVEVPMGVTLREIVFDIGGGIPNGREFKAAQTGGPSGGCIPKDKLDTPIDYESLKEIGSMMGSGGLIVMDDTKCMVSLAKFYLGFTVSESCGKCTPCRIGTKRMLEILEKICDGKGNQEDLEKLEKLAENIKRASVCGLGQTAPNPVQSTMKYFYDEYKEHVIDKKCKTNECKAMAKITIDPEKCKGCGLCQRNCPVGAIEGEGRDKRKINQDKCIKCGTCIASCPFHAIK